MNINLPYLITDEKLKGMERMIHFYSSLLTKIYQAIKSEQYDWTSQIRIKEVQSKIKYLDSLMKEQYYSHEQKEKLNEIRERYYELKKKEQEASLDDLQDWQKQILNKVG